MIRLICTVIAAALLIPTGAAWPQAAEPVTTVLPFDAIPSIDTPRFVDRKAADATYRADEPVLGVVLGNDARAYSTWHLDHHEIVNDTVDGRPVAVTW